MTNTINIRTHRLKMKFTAIRNVKISISFWPWILLVLWRDWNSKSINWKRKWEHGDCIISKISTKLYTFATGFVTMSVKWENYQKSTDSHYHFHWERPLTLVNEPCKILTLLCPRNKQTVVRLQRSCWHIQGIPWTFKWNKTDILVSFSWQILSPGKCRTHRYDPAANVHCVFSTSGLNKAVTSWITYLTVKEAGLCRIVLKDLYGTKIPLPLPVVLIKLNNPTALSEQASKVT